jgi:hypothetical protein
MKGTVTLIEESSMKTTMNEGIALGVLVAIWTFLMGFTGWYKDPVLFNLFWFVIAMDNGTTRLFQ